MKQPSGRVVRLGVTRSVRPRGAKRGGQMNTLSYQTLQTTPPSEAMA